MRFAEPDRYSALRFALIIGGQVRRRVPIWLIIFIVGANRRGCNQADPDERGRSEAPTGEFHDSLSSHG